MHLFNPFPYRFKSMKWWAQSFIVGIPKIVVGYRDDDVNYLLKPMDWFVIINLNLSLIC